MTVSRIMINEREERVEKSIRAVFRILLVSNSTAGGNEVVGMNFADFTCSDVNLLHFFAGFSRQKLTDFLYGELRTAS